MFGSAGASCGPLSRLQSLLRNPSDRGADPMTHAKPVTHLRLTLPGGAMHGERALRRIMRHTHRP